jgi:hypothetical protein
MKDVLQDLHDENERLGLYAQGEIIKLARQAGLCDAEGRDDNSIIITDHLEAFAKLVEDAAQQRTWVGLTEDEIAECFKVTPDQYLTWHIYKRIEAKLKEKNT